MVPVNICVYFFNLAPEVLQGGTYGLNFDWWGYGILIYELLIGVPPFVDDNKHQLYQKIINDEPSFVFFNQKIEISEEAKDLIIKLLNKDPLKRLKPCEIVYHKWFENLTFEDILSGKYKSPFIPKIKGFDDYSNFDKEFLEEDCISPVKKRNEIMNTLQQNQGIKILN